MSNRGTAPRGFNGIQKTCYHDSVPIIEKKQFEGGITGYCVASTPQTRWRVWCYRVGSVLIDTGCSLGLKGLIAALRQDGPISHILFTHHHEDHTGNAMAIRATTGAQLVATQLQRPLIEQGFNIRWYQRKFWGRFTPGRVDEVLTVPFRGKTTWNGPQGDLILHHVPGHSHDSIAIEIPSAGALCTGDLYIHHKVRYVRADELATDTLSSLRGLVNHVQFEQLLCAHNPIESDGKSYLQRKADYFEATASALFDAMQRGMTFEQARQSVLGNEDHKIKILTLGDVSIANLAGSLLGHFRPRRSVIKAAGIEHAHHRF